MSSTFFNTEESVREFAESVSADRLTKYLEQTGGDQTKALQTYTWNTQISAAFYGPLQGLEVALRNAMHRELSRRFGAGWFDNEEAGLDVGAREQIAKAQGDLERRGQGVEASDIVAALSFGFWVSLLRKGGDLGTGHKADYDKTLWLTALRMAFLPAAAGGKLQRRQAHKTLNYLNNFRNRIAHHEPVFHRDLARDHKRILEVAGWISPVTAAWIYHHSRVPELLARWNLARRNDAGELKF